MENGKKLYIKCKTVENWPWTCPKFLREIVPQIHYSDREQCFPNQYTLHASPKEDDLWEKSLIGNEVWGIFLTLCSPLETRNLQPMIRSLNNPIVFPWFQPLFLKRIWTLNSFFLNIIALINRIHLKTSDVESQPHSFQIPNCALL